MEYLVTTGKLCTFETLKAVSSESGERQLVRERR